MPKKQTPIKIPPLKTRRLVLRQLTSRDVKFIFQIFSLEKTNRYVSYEPTKTMAEARELYELYCKPKHNLFRLGIELKATGKLIGTIGLYNVDMANKRAVLGYDLLPEHWGNGYMTEAVAALLDFAFGKLKLNRVQASAEPENKGSLGVIERLGFKKEGVLRQLDWYKGAFHDDVVYSMLKEEWKSKRVSHARTRR